MYEVLGWVWFSFLPMKVNDKHMPFLERNKFAQAWRISAHWVQSPKYIVGYESTFQWGEIFSSVLSYTHFTGVAYSCVKNKSSF